MYARRHRASLDVVVTQSRRQGGSRGAIVMEVVGFVADQQNVIFTMAPESLSESVSGVSG